MTTFRVAVRPSVLAACLAFGCASPSDHEAPAPAAAGHAAAPSAQAVAEAVGSEAAYVLAEAFHKDGFAEYLADGRLWIFRGGSESLATFLASGELPEVHVTRPGAGPDGRTLKSPEKDTLVEWLATRPGFAAFVRDDRLWVFRAGSPELGEFHEKGEPAEQFTRPGAGLGGMTVKGPDRETVEAYLAAS